MHPFFEPLSVADLGLLVTALNRGDGGKQLTLFDHLPSARAQVLRDKGQALLQISADKRVPLMVRELKAQLAQAGRQGLERVDPSWLVAHLKHEPPAILAVILLGLPQPLVRSLLRRLPASTAAALPPKERLQAVPTALRQALTQLVERRFAPMPAPPTTQWGFFDLVHLERRDLNTLVRDLGLIELGQAFAAVGRMALLDLCRRLPRPSAEALVQAVKVAAQAETPDLAAAKFFLSKVVVNFDQTEAFLQRAGLWRLAKATAGVPPQRLAPMLQRLPKRAAEIVGQLHETLNSSAEAAATAAAQATRWQDSVLIRVVTLGQQKAISPPFRAEQLAFADPAAAAAAVAAAAAAPSDAGPSGPPQKN